MTIIVAFLGGLLADRLKLPAAGMTGAMAAVMILGISTGLSYFPSDYRMYVQFMSGAVIGVSVTYEDIKKLRHMIAPAILQIVTMIVLNLVLTVIFIKIGGLDAETSLFSTSPAGVQEMALISADYGADTTIVSFVQLLRIVFIVSVMPPLYRRLIRKSGGAEAEQSAPAEKNGAGAGRKQNWVRILLTLLTACIGGLIFKALKVKSGAFLGAICFTALLSVFSGKAELPRGFKKPVQILAGAYIGAQVSREVLTVLPTLLIPLIVMMLIIVAFIVGEAAIMRKMTGMDMTTCLLISTPGGMQEMALIAQDYDCDAPGVVTMHVVRVLAILSVMPYLALLFVDV